MTDKNLTENGAVKVSAAVQWQTEASDGESTRAHLRALQRKLSRMPQFGCLMANFYVHGASTIVCVIYDERRSSIGFTKPKAIQFIPAP